MTPSSSSTAPPPEAALEPRPKTIKKTSFIGAVSIGFPACSDCPPQGQHCPHPAASVEEVVIGLEVTPGHAVVDTGAQHGICGERQWARVVEQLAVRGLKPRPVPKLEMDAVGVGGKTKFLAAFEIPVGIGGRSGLSNDCY